MALANVANSITVNEPMSWPAVEALDEQRRYPRLPLDIDVAFRNGAGQHCHAKLINISPDGLQVRGNIATAQMLHPAGGKVCASNAPIVQTSILLPFEDGEQALSVCTRLTY